MGIICLTSSSTSTEPFVRSLSYTIGSVFVDIRKIVESYNYEIKHSHRGSTSEHEKMLAKISASLSANSMEFVKAYGQNARHANTHNAVFYNIA